MIHEEICTDEVCKLAKEKGFPQDPNENNSCQIYCWDNLRKIHSLCISAMWYTGEYNRENMYAAPTQSLLQRWLREEKGYDISVTAYPTLARHNKVCYVWEIKSSSDGVSMKSVDSEHTFSTYELALEDAELYCLKKLV